MGVRNLASDGNGSAVQALRPVEHGWLLVPYNTISGISFNIGDAEIVRFRPTSDCYIAFGETVSSGCMVLSAESAEYFHVRGFDRVEVMAVSTNGNLSKAKMDY